MKSVVFSMMIASLLPLFLILLSSLTGYFKTNDSGKISSFSCGFDSFSSPRLHFKMLYFKVVLIFVVFDLEISLISPLIFILKTTWSSVILSLILLILMVGLIFEIFIGSLNWN